MLLPDRPAMQGPPGTKVKPGFTSCSRPSVVAGSAAPEAPPENAAKRLSTKALVIFPEHARASDPSMNVDDQESPTAQTSQGHKTIIRARSGARYSDEGDRPSVKKTIKKSLSVSKSNVAGDSTAQLIETVVNEQMVSAERRNYFIKGEMRTRRSEILPLVELWKIEMEMYREQVQNWRLKLEACVVMGIRPDEPCPMMPPCPSHIPTKPEIADMVLRCRDNKPFQQVIRSATIDSTSAVSKEGNIGLISQSETNGEAVPLLLEVDQVMQQPVCFPSPGDAVTQLPR